jgi:hypothetical protein
VLAIILAVGPALATFLGQIGGAWGARRAAYYSRRVRFSAADVATPFDESVENSTPHAIAAPNASTREPRLQFRIVHVLWIFVWLSLLLSVIKLSGIPFEFVLPLLGGWIMFQLATLRVAEWLSQGRLRSRLGRRSGRSAELAAGRST